MSLSWDVASQFVKLSSWLVWKGFKSCQETFTFFSLYWNILLHYPWGFSQFSNNYKQLCVETKNESVRQRLFFQLYCLAQPQMVPPYVEGMKCSRRQTPATLFANVPWFSGELLQRHINSGQVIYLMRNQNQLDDFKADFKGSHGDTEEPKHLNDTT